MATKERFLICDVCILLIKLGHLIVHTETNLADMTNYSNLLCSQTLCAITDASLHETHKTAAYFYSYFDVNCMSRYCKENIIDYFTYTAAIAYLYLASVIGGLIGSAGP